MSNQRRLLCHLTVMPWHYGKRDLGTFRSHISGHLRAFAAKDTGSWRNLRGLGGRARKSEGSHGSSSSQRCGGSGLSRTRRSNPVPRRTKYTDGYGSRAEVCQLVHIPARSLKAPWSCRTCPLSSSLPFHETLNPQTLNPQPSTPTLPGLVSNGPGEWRTKVPGHVYLMNVLYM